MCVNLYLEIRPNFKSYILLLLSRFPYMRLRLARKNKTNINKQVIIKPDHQPPRELSYLSPHAYRIYVELKVAIDNKKEKN